MSLVLWRVCVSVSVRLRPGVREEGVGGEVREGDEGRGGRTMGGKEWALIWSDSSGQVSNSGSCNGTET